MVKRVALRKGWMEPDPFVYPFWQMMAHCDSAYPNYLWGTLCAASLARSLGYERISVVEFGVAGGNGLLALEGFAKLAENLSGVVIDTYGFDTGTGLPKPVDYRDLPQMWSEGHFAMDSEKLRDRLERARLILGPVASTIPDFVASKPAPIGFASFDMDLYSSTTEAFGIFDGLISMVLPRVVCYFDDIIGFSHSDFTGERLAISEFNDHHELRKLSKIYGLRYVLVLDQWWTEMMYMAHFFDHERYTDYDGTNRLEELPLSDA
jgi:hypothetical protein